MNKSYAQAVKQVVAFNPMSRKETRYWDGLLGTFAKQNSYDELEDFILNTGQTELAKMPHIPPFCGATQLQHYQVDSTASEQCPNAFRSSDLLCVKSSPDSNCFANALSLLVYGNEDHATEMRV